MIDKLVDFVLMSLSLFRVCHIVKEYESGVVLRLGRFHRLAAPGLRWVWPMYVEELMTVSTVPEKMNVGPQSLTTSDGVSIVIATVVTFTVHDCKTFLLGIEGANHAIEDCTYGAVSGLVLSSTWEELLQSNLQQDLTDTVAQSAARYGVTIQSVQVSDFTKSKSLRLIQQFQNRFESAQQP